MLPASERNTSIFRERQAGATYSLLAGRYGLSVARVRQIYLHEARRPREEARKAAILAFREREEQAERDRRSAFAARVPDTPIDELEISVRAYLRLDAAGVRTARQVAEMSADELRSIPGIGGSQLREIQEVIAVMAA